MRRSNQLIPHEAVMVKKFANGKAGFMAHIIDSERPKWIELCRVFRIFPLRYDEDQMQVIYRFYVPEWYAKKMQLKPMQVDHVYVPYEEERDYWTAPNHWGYDPDDEIPF